MKTWELCVKFYCVCTNSFREHREIYEGTDFLLRQRIREIVCEGFACDVSPVIGEYEEIHVSPTAIFSVLIKEV